jgi:dTDP-L-rhamnose 4-epimerase
MLDHVALGPRNVLVTGGAGFIGRRVCAQLRTRGHQVRVLDSFRPEVHPHRPRPAVDLAVGDVRDAAVVATSLDGIDTVVHLAAKVGLGVGTGDLPDYASSNDLGTAVLLSEMANADVGRLVLASSMVVYGAGLGRCGEHGVVRLPPRSRVALEAGRFDPPCPSCGRELSPVLVPEDTPLEPQNAYAASKVAQENFASSWARLTGASVAYLRYHNVYGPGLPRDTPYAGVTAIWMSSLLAGRAPQVHEDGRQRRDFVHVDDVAAATCAAAERLGEGVLAYNVGSGRPRTIGEMAHAMAAAAGGPAPVVTGRYRLGDVRHITADSSRVRAEFGLGPTADIGDGVRSLFVG